MGFCRSRISNEQELSELEELNFLVEEEQQQQSQGGSLNKPTQEVDKNEKWYKFNDTSIEEINLNENTLIG